MNNEFEGEWLVQEYRGKGLSHFRMIGVHSNDYGEFVFKDHSFCYFDGIMGTWQAFDPKGNFLEAWTSNK